MNTPNWLQTTHPTDAQRILEWLEKNGLDPNNITNQQIEHLSRHPSTETNTDKITRWLTAIALTEDRLRQKQTRQFFDS